MISARQRRTSSLSVREKKDGNMYGGLLHKSGKGKKANFTINFRSCRKGRYKVMLEPEERMGALYALIESLNKREKGKLVKFNE